GLLPSLARPRRAGAAAAGLPAAIPRLLPVLPRPPQHAAEAARAGRARARLQRTGLIGQPGHAGPWPAPAPTLGTLTRCPLQLCLGMHPRVQPEWRMP